MRLEQREAAIVEEEVRYYRTKPPIWRGGWNDALSKK